MASAQDFEFWPCRRLKQRALLLGLQMVDIKGGNDSFMAAAAAAAPAAAE